MNDLNDKVKERWHQRRRKSYNWTKLMIMVAALAAILWGMSELNKSSEKVNWTSSPETIETPTEPAPEQTP